MLTFYEGIFDCSDSAEYRRTRNCLENKVKLEDESYEGVFIHSALLISCYFDRSVYNGDEMYKLAATFSSKCSGSPGNFRK
jgi:hypothetical protein